VEFTCDFSFRFHRIRFSRCSLCSLQSSTHLRSLDSGNVWSNLFCTCYGSNGEGEALTTTRVADKKKGTLLYLVMDDEKQVWFIVEAHSVEEAAEKARENHYDPYYIVEERLAIKVGEEEQLWKKINREKP